jgi:hypothetical protein
MRLIPVTALEMVLLGVFLLGLILIGLGLVSLLRKFVPGSSPATDTSRERRDFVAAELSIGWGVTVFAGVALLLRLLRVDPTMSIVVGLGLGLLVAFAILGTLVYLRRPVSVLDPLEAEGVVGRVAEVVIAVPGTGVGEIRVITPAGPVNLAARSVGDHFIPVGVPVMVERYGNRVAVVREMTK